MSFRMREARPQATVPQEPFHRWTLPNGTSWTLFFRNEDGYLLRFPQLADFQVSARGTYVECWPTPEADAATVEHLHLNQVLPLALSRTGKLMLHASAVEIAGRCVAFIGQSGRGKSTLAASFAGSGSRFLTDDGLQAEWDGTRFVAHPGHPSVRLWDDSHTALAGGHAGTRAASYTSKARLQAGKDLAHCAEARPLEAIYFLGNGDASKIEIRPVPPASAAIELVRHSFLLDVVLQEILAAHFEEISRMASAPLHYHLDYPRQFEALPAVRSAIVCHLQKAREAAA
jgi:hypothetical protein